MRSLTPNAYSKWLPEYNGFEGCDERSPRLVDFNMGEILGKGSYGKVYSITSKETHTEYALKIMEKTAIELSNAQEQTLTEIMLLKQINQPNIIKLLGYFEDAKNIYLILELADRLTLFSAIEVNQGMEESAAAKILYNIANAISYLHRQRPAIVHRDIKPENIVYVGDNWKLADFGSANTIDKIKKDTMCGTPEYLAPEMITKQGHGVKVDCWAFGILAYEIVHGATPYAEFIQDTAGSTTELFNKLTTAIIKQKITFKKPVSLEFSDLINRCLRKDSNKRLGSTEILKHPFFVSQGLAVQEMHRIFQVTNSMKLSPKVLEDESIDIPSANQARRRKQSPEHTTDYLIVDRPDKNKDIIDVATPSSEFYNKVEETYRFEVMTSPKLNKVTGIVQQSKIKEDESIIYESKVKQSVQGLPRNPLLLSFGQVTPRMSTDNDQILTEIPSKFSMIDLRMSNRVAEMKTPDIQTTCKKEVLHTKPRKLSLTNNYGSSQKPKYPVENRAFSMINNVEILESELYTTPTKNPVKEDKHINSHYQESCSKSLINDISQVDKHTQKLMNLVAENNISEVNNEANLNIQWQQYNHRFKNDLSFIQSEGKVQRDTTIIGTSIVDKQAIQAIGTDRYAMKNSSIHVLGQSQYMQSTQRGPIEASRVISSDIKQAVEAFKPADQEDKYRNYCDYVGDNPLYTTRGQQQAKRSTTGIQSRYDGQAIRHSEYDPHKARSISPRAAKRLPFIYNDNFVNEYIGGLNESCLIDDDGEFKSKAQIIETNAHQSSTREMYLEDWKKPKPPSQGQLSVPGPRNMPSRDVSIDRQFHSNMDYIDKIKRKVQNIEDRPHSAQNR